LILLVFITILVIGKILIPSNARFLEDWLRDAFLPFSGGPRACLGKKFGETEGIAALTMLVSQFKITV